MIQINKVELQGYVGNVKENQVNDSYVYNFSLATNFSYGNVIETTWHSIRVWSDKKLTIIEKGKPLHVQGHLRTQQYVDSNGNDRTSIYISVKPEDVKTVVN